MTFITNTMLDLKELMLPPNVDPKKPASVENSGHVISIFCVNSLLIVLTNVV